MKLTKKSQGIWSREAREIFFFETSLTPKIAVWIVGRAKSSRLHKALEADSALSSQIKRGRIESRAPFVTNTFVSIWKSSEKRRIATRFIGFYRGKPALNSEKSFFHSKKISLNQGIIYICFQSKVSFSDLNKNFSCLFFSLKKNLNIYFN